MESTASTDWIATANDGNDQRYFIDLGINGSGNSDPAYTMMAARDGYLYVNGANLVIGTDSAYDVKFFTGGTLAANEKVRIVNATGNVLIGTTTDNTLDKIQIPLGSNVNFSIRECFEDFLFSSLTSNPFSVVAVTADGGACSGACSIETDATGNDYMGLVVAETGTTSNSTGHAVIDFFNSSNKIRLGGSRLCFSARVRVPNLSTAQIGYQLIVGLQNSNTVGFPTNGIYFAYTHSTNSGKWVCTCTNTSASTFLNSLVSVSASTWYMLRAEINAAGNSVSFYINNTLVGTITTNIPASTTGLRFMSQIDKTTLSTTSRQLHTDFFYWKMFR